MFARTAAQVCSAGVCSAGAGIAGSSAGSFMVGVSFAASVFGRRGGPAVLPSGFKGGRKRYRRRAGRPGRRPALHPERQVNRLEGQPKASHLRALPGGEGGAVMAGPHPGVGDDRAVLPLRSERMAIALPGGLHFVAARQQGFSAADDGGRGAGDAGFSQRLRVQGGQRLHARDRGVQDSFLSVICVRRGSRRHGFRRRAVPGVCPPASASSAPAPPGSPPPAARPGSGGRRGGRATG